MGGGVGKVGGKTSVPEISGLVSQLQQRPSSKPQWVVVESVLGVSVRQD